MIVRNAMQTKYLHPASNVNAGSWVKYKSLALLLAMPLCPVAAISAEVSRAPLPVMQANPAMMRYYDPRPSSARVLGAGNGQFHLDQHYASIFLADTLPNPRRYLADMELYVAEAGIRYGVSKTCDIELDVPVMRPLAGMLDPFLRDYHQALGFPNGGRRFRPDNVFAYRYRGVIGGWRGQPRWEMGNIRLKLRRQLLKDVLTVMAGIQLPTASRTRGWTNGGTDMGLGAVWSWRSGTGTWFTHLSGWWLHPFARDDAGSPARNYLRAAFTVGREVTLLPVPLNLIVQIQGGSSPYHTGIMALDAAPWLMSVGLRWATGQGTQWSFGFIENITQESTQDFGISLGASIPFSFAGT